MIAPRALCQWLAFAAFLPGPPVSADSRDEMDAPSAIAAQARVDYMLNCQGCHSADGSGTADGAVPTMKNFVGRFLEVDGGREFLVRVPGSANAALTDLRLARLLNWMLPTVSAEQVPEDFRPYTADEVAALRAQPLADVQAERGRLLAAMEAAGNKNAP